MNLRTIFFGLVIFGFGFGSGLWAGKSPPPHNTTKVISCQSQTATVIQTPPVIPCHEPKQKKIVTPISTNVQSAAQLLNLARQALAKNELAQAQNWIDKIRKIAPYDPEVELLYGEWQYRRGDHAAGLRHLIERRALERDPNRLTQIDALLDQWLPDFIQHLTTEGKLDFLPFLMRNLPNNGNYALQLAELETSLGKYSEAKSTLIPILYDPVWGESARRLDSLIEDRISWDWGQKVPLEIKGKQTIIAVRVNGNPGLRLLIDTGASLTVLSRSAIERMGLTVPNAARRVQLQTISGTTIASLMRTDLELGAVQLPEREIAIIDSVISPELDGLLGMDILGNYEFMIDQKQALLLLRLKQ